MYEIVLEYNPRTPYSFQLILIQEVLEGQLRSLTTIKKDKCFYVIVSVILVHLWSVTSVLLLLSKISLKVSRIIVIG